MKYLNPTWFITKGPEFYLAHTLYFTHGIASIFGGSCLASMILFVGWDEELVIACICCLFWIYTGNMFGFVLLLLGKDK